MTLALTKVYQVRSRTEEAFGSVTSSWSFVICCLLRTDSYKYEQRGTTVVAMTNDQPDTMLPSK
ncbi:unnamed protein product [Ascophyllum nodosum]